MARRLDSRKAVPDNLTLLAIPILEQLLGDLYQTPQTGTCLGQKPAESPCLASNEAIFILQSKILSLRFDLVHRDQSFQHHCLSMPLGPYLTPSCPQSLLAALNPAFKYLITLWREKKKIMRRREEWKWKQKCSYCGVASVASCSWDRKVCRVGKKELSPEA